MEYLYEQISETDWQITTLVNQKPLFFILSSDLERGLPEHIQMIQDFQDVSKLEYFIQLLINDPNTAFTTYLGLNIGT